MSTLPRRFAPSILAAVAFLLAGCGGLLSSPDPRDLYFVTPATEFPPGLPHIPAQLTIDTIDAPAGLDTNRIALSRAPLSLDYYAKVAWTDQAPAMVRTALLEGFENSHAFKAVGSSGFNLSADYTLKTELRDFQAVYDSRSAAPTIVVELGLKLIKMPAREIVAQTVIRERETAAANGIPQAVAAFDAALHREVAQVVEWAASHAALSPPRR